MNLGTSMAHTHAWVQEELAAQRRLLEILTDLEQAIRTNDSGGMLTGQERLEQELRTNPARERRRADLLAGFARTFEVPPGTLTLTSIVERSEALGVDASRLTSLRNELRAAVAAVVKRGRRIASLARYHQGVLAELVQVLTASTEAEAPLIDAEA